MDNNNNNKKAPFTAEELNNLASAIAYNVVRDMSQKMPSVELYARLKCGAIGDGKLFEKALKGEYLESLKDRVNSTQYSIDLLTEQKKALKEEVKALKKVDIFSTPAELYAEVLKQIEEDTAMIEDYADSISRENSILLNQSEDLKRAEQAYHAPTFSDFRDIVNTAIVAILEILKYNKVNYIPSGENFRKVYKYACKKIHKYITTMSNPDCAIGTKTVISKEQATEEEIKQYLQHTKTTTVDGESTEEIEILTFRDDTRQCSWTIRHYAESKQRKEGFYKVYKYKNYSKYQYISAFEDKEGNMHSLDNQTLYKIQAPFEIGFSDVEKLLALIETCNLTEREQVFIHCFIGASQKVYLRSDKEDYTPQKEYKMLLDYTFKKMKSKGYPAENRAKFLYNLKQKIVAVFGNSRHLIDIMEVQEIKSTLEKNLDK